MSINIVFNKKDIYTQRENTRLNIKFRNTIHFILFYIFCDNLGILSITNNILGIINIVISINIINNPSNFLCPNFALSLLWRTIDSVFADNAVWTTFLMRSTIITFLLFSARTLFSACTFRTTPIM